ncbi:MAG: YbaK/EbsC family protein [Phycisphaeraceae bacterium]
MSESSNRLLPYLDQHDIEYELIHHRLDYSAQRAAADTHTPGRAFAKAVILDVGGQPVMAVVPAPEKIDLGKASQALGAEVKLVDESTLARIFPDAEVGAEPPFGNLYDLPVYVSPHLVDDESITFNAGSHQQAVRMRWEDYERMVHPQVADLTYEA